MLGSRWYQDFLSSSLAESQLGPGRLVVRRGHVGVGSRNLGNHGISNPFTWDIFSGLDHSVGIKWKIVIQRGSTSMNYCIILNLE